MVGDGSAAGVWADDDDSVNACGAPGAPRATSLVRRRCVPATLSEAEQNVVWGQIDKVEFFLLRSLSFYLELPAADGRHMLDVDVQRLRLISSTSAFRISTAPRRLATPCSLR